jgi:RND family efflux transporter MFP subunit
MAAALTLSLAAALTGCGGGAETAVVADGSPVEVATAMASTQDLPEAIEAGGVLRGHAHAVIAARIMANVVAVNVQAGDRVRAGQILVVLDSAELAARVDQAVAGESAAARRLDGARSEREAAEAGARLARVTSARIARLFEHRSATAQEHDEALAALRAAEARLTAAEAGVAEATAGADGARAGRAAAEAAAAYARVGAPFAGVVTERSIDPGQLVVPGTTLVRIEDTSVLELEIKVDESRAALASPGATVQVLVEGAEPAIRNGRIAEISRAVDTDARAVLVTVAVADTNSLRPGMFARAELPGPIRRVLSVPVESLVRRGQLTSVFVVERDRARLRLVRVGRSDGSRVEVLAGLSEGETVVVRPPASLRDGAAVSSYASRGPS